MRILITGVSGFVGRPLARRLLALGHEVAGTYLGEPPAVGGANLEGAGLEEVDLEEVDLEDRAGLTGTVRRHSPEVIVHLAGLSHVGSSWQRPGEYFRVNVLGTENVLAAADGRKVLFASSAEVYGRVAEDQQPIGEDVPLSPGSPYALTKAAAERLALAAGAVVVRSFNALGPGQAATFALPAFAAQLAAVAQGRQEPVVRVGNLEPRRDFLHVDDVVEGYVLLASAGAGGTVYNLASGSAVSVAELLDQLIRISGQEVRVEIDPERLRPVDVPLLCGNSGRLRQLGWKPRRSLGEALTELWNEAAARGA